MIFQKNYKSFKAKKVWDILNFFSIEKIIPMLDPLVSNFGEVVTR
jgi:hypothetical protein